MQSFGFDRLDPVALEATLAYLRQHPEPPTEDVAIFGGYQGMLDEVVQEKDWMAEPWEGEIQDVGGQSSLRDHLECHSFDVVAQWTRGSKCTWQGCKTQAVFKTPSQIKEHLKNIHTEPLLCYQPGCLYTKPFRHMVDLNRHKSTKYCAEPKWECPYSSCLSELCIFARKDKWLKHIQDTNHENDGHCPLPHYILGEGYRYRLYREPHTRKGVCAHLTDYHVWRNADGYSCSLGSCVKSRYLDRWTLNGLRRHLHYQHEIFIYESELEEMTNNVFTLEHISRYRPDLLEEWVDCKICASQLETAAQPPSTN